jgi:hypothetical protein
MKTLTHNFVRVIPEEIESGVIYVSVEYCTAIHKCCCGCGNEVVTPLSRKGWKLTFDGESISLYPSIGNWNLACKSHYWITDNQVRWAEKWTKERGKKEKKKWFPKLKGYLGRKKT